MSGNPEAISPAVSVASAGVGSSGSASVTARVARGALMLGFRQVLGQGVSVLGGILLARLLSPAEFGIYGVITFVVAFLITFGDVGLGASLVRQSEEPSVVDYRAVFTVQQLLVLAVLLAFWILAPRIAQAYERPPEDVLVFRLVALSILFTSFQSIASIRLERHLSFGKLAAIEVTQVVVFNVLAVGLAWMGMGVMSFALALLARSAVGAILANLISRWRPGLHWDLELVRHHLRFGLPYQGISFVSTLKDSITPVLVGLVLGAAQVGYINWAGMLAVYPVLAVAVLNRIYFPAFSRMQAYPDQLGRFLERVLRVTNALVAPLAVLILVLAVPVTQLVFGEKWVPALPLFYLMWIANLVVPTATPLMGVLNALGRSDVAFRLALIWMFGTWLLGAPLILMFGTIGFAIANLIVQATNLYLYQVVRSRVDFHIVGPVVPPWGAAAAAGLAVWLLTRWAPPTTLVGLAVYAAFGGLLYVVSMVMLDPKGTSRLLSWLRSDVWSLAYR